MSGDAMRNAVADYVLGPDNRERLELAATVHDAWETIRLRVIGEFSCEIAQVISDELPEPDNWSVVATYLLTNPTEIYTWLGVRHMNWEDGLQVRIEAEASGPSRWIIGVYRDGGYQRADELAGCLDNQYRAGTRSAHWPWYHKLSDNAEFGNWELGDWRTGRAVLALSEGAKGEYGVRLRKRIAELARTVDNFLNREPPAAGQAVVPAVR